MPSRTLRQAAVVALATSAFGCEHATQHLPGARLRQADLSGVAIRPGPSGGRAEPIYLGTLYVPGAHGHFGGKRRLAARIARGSSGAGGFGLGGGGGGYGHGGGASGRLQLPSGSSHAEQVRTQTLRALTVSPWGFAELQLPYRGGPTAHFMARPDAKIAAVINTQKDSLSTFAIDVDTASYSLARRSLNGHRMPEPTLVRVEEFINYFKYNYEPPHRARELFSIQADGARSPLNQDTYLLRVGLQAKVIEPPERAPSNLVFLVDTSCSMTSPDKLELAKKSIVIAAQQLDARDQVAITTYAGGVRLVLEPTSGAQQAKIIEAVEGLGSSGGTAMASGMTLAYEQAARMQKNGNPTRVIVLSDGDANIGATKPDEILKHIAKHVEQGVFLSTIGYGDGNYRDAMMEQLANRGNGNYFYIDSIQHARRVFAHDFSKMIQDVAQDVKIQVEMNRSIVANYRLIGYENRALKNEDFRDDRVDAGEIGAGHQVTALYELKLHPRVSGRLATVRVRAKKPKGKVAKEVALNVPVTMVRRNFRRAPADLRFATAVMGAAELMRRSPRAQEWRLQQVQKIAQRAQGADPDRVEFVRMLDRAIALHEAGKKFKVQR